VAFSAWFAACSSDNTPASNTDAGPGETGGSGGGSGGKAGSSGSGASAGKAGAGGSSGGSAGAAGSAGKAGSAGAAGSAGSSAGDAGDAGLPGIKIDKPKTGDVVGPGTDAPDYPDVPVSFTVTNFTLKAPQSANCTGDNCGHVHLIVDNASCNDPATPTLYNAAGFMSPINAGLDYCKGGVAGSHTIILELHRNDHTPVKGADGKVISDSVQITALEEDGGAPKDAGGSMTDH